MNSSPHPGGSQAPMAAHLPVSTTTPDHAASALRSAAGSGMARPEPSWTGGPNRGAAEGLNVQLAQALAEVTHLSRALEQCRDIGAAIGILMATKKVTREAAFDILRLHSSQQNRKLHAIACDLVDTGELPAVS